MKYLLCFRKPYLESFSYSAIVLRDRPYLLFSWRMHYGRSLRIRKFRFRSTEVNGSAYLLIRKEQESVRIRVSNLWRSFTLTVPVVYTEVEQQVDIVPVKIFPDLQEKAVYRPELSVMLPVASSFSMPVKIAGFSVRTINLNY